MRGREFSTVFATRDSLNGWTSITMERVFSDTGRVTRFVDSLNTAFVAAGLLPHRCATGAHRWQADGLVVQVEAARPRAAGGYLVTFLAVGSPGAIPRLMCPDAPPLAPRDPFARTM